MACILIVDDEPTNRELLCTLLAYGGHRMLEAADGREALGVVRAERPDLVIADILMPTMDGYEFVRCLRADATVAATRVIFYTAHYLEREARDLAARCGVAQVLTKPSEPEVILDTVATALAGGREPPTPPPIAAQFDREHLRVLSDTLARKVEETEAVNRRLAGLIEVAERLALERDPGQLLAHVTRTARRMIGARHAMVAVRANGSDHWKHVVASGLPPETASRLNPPPPDRGVLSTLFADATSLRLDGADASAADVGLPPEYPPIDSLLAVRVSSPSRQYGWLCLTDRLGAGAFSDDDERLAITIGSLAGRVYENGSLYTEIRQRAEALKAEVEERRQAEAALHRRTQMSILAADVGKVLTFETSVDAMLQRCAETVARHLPEGAVGLWLRPNDAGGGAPVLRAAAGVAADAAFLAAAAPLIGRVVDQAATVATDAPLPAGDAGTGEPLTALLAYPLHIGNDSLGALVIGARSPLATTVRDGLAAVADAMAIGLHRAQTVEALHALNAELEQRVADRTAAMDAANRELEAFSFSVSHDLRSPLRHIEGFSRVLLESHAAQLDAEGRQHLDRICAGTERMGQLITDLLGLARVSRHEMRRGPVSLSDIATDVATELRAADPTRVVAVDVAPGLTAVGDAHLLRVALQNLLENAWKYTRKQPAAQIAFGHDARDDGAAYFVRDNGAGFDMAFADRLFVAFQRLHSVSEFEGTGIGLATVQRIIHRHGGQIWAESVPEQGSTFWFTLGDAADASDGVSSKARV